jgi:formate dehydrogenase accessory protein FdhE
VKVSPWQQRIARAQDLAAQHPFAAEVLGFYVHLARFQEDMYQQLASTLPPESALAPINRELGAAEKSALTDRFGAFLTLVEGHGPKPSAAVSRELRGRGQNSWRELLNGAWTSPSASNAPGVLAQAFLQPYAELLRSRVSPHPPGDPHAVCPFCNRKPAIGVMRPLSDGAARSLVCFFCLHEWDFRRIVCPACGEENDRKLHVFSATDFDYIRVECCETCKTYLKTVDLSKNGRAEPVVDDLASAPLDLWARARGYARVQNNILGM